MKFLNYIIANFAHQETIFSLEDTYICPTDYI